MPLTLAKGESHRREWFDFSYSVQPQALSITIVLLADRESRETLARSASTTASPGQAAVSAMRRRALLDVVGRALRIAGDVAATALSGIGNDHVLVSPIAVTRAAS